VRQALALADARDHERTRVLAARFWPGALTIVTRRATDVALELGEPETTIGLRCPDDDLVRAIAREVGALATTSANRHGRPTPPAAASVANELGSGVALVIDGGSRSGVPSTVVDVTGPRPTVLREGSVSAAAIERTLAGGG
jgi:tRNA threonylcarbamoyl adenosine modification protein (Sua5/YciO/YrdC/YwlC family)